MSNPLVELLRNHVLADEIDELGHLSVPFYESRALIASRLLANELGCHLSAQSADGTEFTLVDSYLKNVREQFLDAPLVVRGGVLKASAERLSIYQEIFNSEQDVLAAAFIHKFELRRRDMSEQLPFGDEVVQRATDAVVDIPEYGPPRSIDLNKPPNRLSFGTARLLELPCTQPRSIEAEECDETGLFLREQFASLPYRGFSDDEQTMEWVYETKDGRRLGLADLESRNVLYGLPREGDQIQVFSANVKLERKVLQRSHWIFNLRDESLISAAMTVSIPLDLDARKSVAIPPEMREKLAQQFHPDLL
jgi:acyl-CoA thioester hydrolase